MNLKSTKNISGIAAAATLFLFLVADTVVVKAPINGWQLLFKLPFDWYSIFAIIFIIGLLATVFLMDIPQFDTIKNNPAINNYCIGKTEALVRLVSLSAGLPYFLYWIIKWDSMVKLTAFGVVLMLITIGNIYLAYTIYAPYKSSK